MIPHSTWGRTVFGNKQTSFGKENFLQGDSSRGEFSIGREVSGDERIREIL